MKMRPVPGAPLWHREFLGAQVSHEALYCPDLPIVPRPHVDEQSLLSSRGRQLSGRMAPVGDRGSTDIIRLSSIRLQLLVPKY